MSQQTKAPRVANPAGRARSTGTGMKAWDRVPQLRVWTNRSSGTRVDDGGRRVSLLGVATRSSKNRLTPSPQVMAGPTESQTRSRDYVPLGSGRRGGSVVAADNSTASCEPDWLGPTGWGRLVGSGWWNPGRWRGAAREATCRPPSPSGGVPVSGAVPVSGRRACRQPSPVNKKKGRVGDPSAPLISHFPSASS